LNIIIDTHTHTVSSGHAYSTIQEMAGGASNNGIQMFAVTDHGPSMCGAPCLYHFGNLKIIPPEIYGVRILKGAEANIIDYTGEIDIPEDYLKNLDIVLAGFHEVCLKPSDAEDHTAAFCSVMKNPFIDAVSHPGNGLFMIDAETAVKAVRDNGKLVEINNHSFKIRKGSHVNCRNIALLCMKHEVRVICGSDAHISFDVGKFEMVKKLFDEIGFPEELVLNTSVEKVERYINDKKRNLGI
jgi:putative hydrolase